MAKPTYGGKASAGGRDDPMVKGSLGSRYASGDASAKEAAAEIAEGLANPKHSSPGRVQDFKFYQPAAPQARPGFRLVKELDGDFDPSKGTEQAGLIRITPEMIEAGDDALSLWCPELSTNNDLAWVVTKVFEAMCKARMESPTEGTGKT